jgi:hypothetical protein
MLSKQVGLSVNPMQKCCEDKLPDLLPLEMLRRIGVECVGEVHISCAQMK